MTAGFLLLAWWAGLIWFWGAMQRPRDGQQEVAERYATRDNMTGNRWR